MPTDAANPAVSSRSLRLASRGDDRVVHLQEACGTETSGGHNCYHLSEDIADDAIHWLREQKAYAPDKPFFMYWAAGASHGPHQVPKEWADKYQGKFDQGWDKLREEVFAREKAHGWIPADTELTPRDPTMPAWNSIPQSERPFQLRLMDLYAGFCEHTAAQVGKRVEFLDQTGQGDNTLIFYIWGVNDIAPTLYDVLDIKPPKEVNGFAQDPIDGVSMTASFHDAKAPENKHLFRQQRQRRHLS
jgi:arylsulfatase A-like enzyme